MQRRLFSLLGALVILATFAPAPAAAQFGIRGGLNLTSFVGGDANAEGKQGLKAGGSLQLLSFGPISIVPEVYYAQKGAKQTGTVDGQPQPVLVDFSLDYIEVPVLAKLSLPGTRSVRPYLAAGPAYGWKLDCEAKVVQSDESIPDCADVLGETFSTSLSAMRSADRGLVFSGGIDFNVMNMGIVNLDARLVRGLDRLSEGSEGRDVKNQAFSLMLGYSFGVGGWR
jgi:hypothetical protein